MDVAGPTEMSADEAAAHYCTVDVSANPIIDLTSDQVACILSAIPFDGVEVRGGCPTRHPDGQWYERVARQASESCPGVVSGWDIRSAPRVCRGRLWERLYELLQAGGRQCRCVAGLGAWV
ncbi:hypothetical protein NDU88_004393 [Pleurodeles waltl]|uniref:Uncharacterized protein n=1 Tax=Pleurodeles waltl TaxID=8319 RepID=A0AAV7RI11_PLEWA|nr:hypothetical protein NDU88_004393 [Pleurodeles waltl]